MAQLGRAFSWTATQPAYLVPGELRAASDGSKSTAELALRFRAALTAYFRKRVRSADDAEDLTQEVFIRLLATERSVEPAALKGYVFQVAGSVLVDWIRRGKVRGDGTHDCLTETLADDGIGCERSLLARERLDCVRAGFRELPEKTQSILLLRRLEGRKNAEIADHLGVSVSTVEKHIHQATAHLRNRLDERF